MTGAREDDETVAGIRALIARASDELALAGARDEALARFQSPRRTFVITRRATMVPLGRVWRLGVFLLGADKCSADKRGADKSGTDATLYATGSTTRAVEPGRPVYQSESAETRRVYRAAAFAGPFERGETVNFDARIIDLSADGLHSSRGPLVLLGGRPMVRWTTAVDSAATPFDEYIADRVELLVHPPEGA